MQMVVIMFVFWLLGIKASIYIDNLKNYGLILAPKLKEVLFFFFFAGLHFFLLYPHPIYFHFFILSSFFCLLFLSFSLLFQAATITATGTTKGAAVKPSSLPPPLVKVTLSYLLSWDLVWPCMAQVKEQTMWVQNYN